MPIFDFVVDYKTPAGMCMHQSHKVLKAESVTQAAAWLMHELKSKGFQVVYMIYIPGDRSLKELDTAAEHNTGVGRWWPVYLDYSAVMDMAATC